MGAPNTDKVGLASFFGLVIISLAAFVCGLTAIGYCAFARRTIVAGANFDEVCSAYGIPADQCLTLTKDNGVGFWGWQATVPVDQTVCFSYTQYIGSAGYVTPWFDTNFNMAKASTFIANIFGGIGFFVVFIAICCPIEQSRLKMLACCFFLATLFQGLTLLIFASNVCKEGFFASYFPSLNGENPVLSNIVQSVSCSLDTGSQLAVSATALYFVCILLVQTAVAPKPIGMSDYDEDTPAPATDGDAEEQPVA